MADADGAPAGAGAATGPRDRLPASVIGASAAPRMGIGIMGILFVTYLMKFATDVLLIAPAVMGTLIAASRLWDAVSDPVAGYLSDRTRSRHGRRRSWMYASAVPMGLALVMIWAPPAALGPLALVAWMAAALVVYETASTAFFVPHGALGLELTPHYHERTRLFGWTHMIGSVGMLIGLGSLQLMNAAEDKRAAAVALSMVAGVCVSALVLWSTHRLPERADFQGRGGRRIFTAFLDVARNPHSRLLLLVYGIETFGAASIGMLVPYLVEYVVPMRELMVPLLITYTVPQFALTPLWIHLAGRFGKKRLWLFSMVVTAIGFAAFFPMEEPGIAIWLVTFAIGFAGGCGAVVAPSIQADIVDYDEFRTGERKEGAYLAVWNLVRKGAGSVTALATGWVLQLSGFEPNVEQGETAKLAIRGLFSLLPAACYLIGALLFVRFAFNEAEHREVRRVLDARRPEAS